MHATISPQNQAAREAELRKEIEELEKQIGPGVDAEAMVKKHIKQLHKYNEAKDATQILIGKLATLKDSTIRQIHEDMDLRPED